MNCGAHMKERNNNGSIYVLIKETYPTYVHQLAYRDVLHAVLTRVSNYMILNVDRLFTLMLYFANNIPQ